MKRETLKDMGLYILILLGGVSVDYFSNFVGVFLVGIPCYLLGKRHQRRFAKSQKSEVKK